MSTELDKAWELVNAGDIPGTLNHLRTSAGDRLPADLAAIMRRVAEAAGFDDLAEAAGVVAANPEDPQALYNFGYACIERAVAYIAVYPLKAALALVPYANGVLRELVAALEDEQRHGEAVALLVERDSMLEAWPDRYLLVFNALMDGQLDLAAAELPKLPAPEDERWRPAHERVRRMVERAGAARTAGPLDREDLRGWHFVLGGGFLTTLSPYGYNEGMTGRYAYLQDTYGSCLGGLRRLQLVLETAGRQPTSVSLLPDRASQVLGLAAARFLGPPARPYAPGTHDTVVVAYNLADVDEELLATLYERVPGEVLYEHATCWTRSPAVSADVSTLLHQVIIAPWGPGRMRQTADKTMEQAPADERPADELVAEILQAEAEAGADSAEAGDGGTPPDPEQNLAAFVTAAAGQWLVGPRERVRSTGPVRSSRFQ